METLKLYPFINYQVKEIHHSFIYIEINISKKKV